MYESDYGKGMNKSKDDGYVIPGSPDARKSAYSRDMYDSMSGGSSYGKKVATKKNRTGTGDTNTGIQGGGGGTVTKEASYGSKTYRKDYGGAAGKTSKGKGMEHDEYDYGKGRMKQGDQRRRVKSQGK